LTIEQTTPLVGALIAAAIRALDRFVWAVPAHEAKQAISEWEAKDKKVAGRY
jgi:hypothetical protein